MSRQNGNAQVYDDRYENMEENEYSSKRNPYLVDYAQQRSYQERNKARYINTNLAEAVTASRPARQDARSQTRRGERAAARPSARSGASMTLRSQAQSADARTTHRQAQSADAGTTYGQAQSADARTTYRQVQSVNSISSERGIRSAGSTASGRQVQLVDIPSERQNRSMDFETTKRSPRHSGQASRAARMRRKKRIHMQRLAVGLWIVCIFLLGTFFAVRNREASAASNSNNEFVPNQTQNTLPETEPKEILVQGIPKEKFDAHPEWEENFLTPNEYSRPGDLLEADDVTNIFVHYTANPGTSAKQNRSYFEQQKDLHKASVSAHFIIGYEGEIIQCVPLDEIAYAVQTRNYDSISIECCFLAKDGSFTQETYDSLVELLAWLIDTYGLDSEDILRHYDCGGKKCPLYYTNNPEAWVQLKKDVDNYK